MMDFEIDDHTYFGSTVGNAYFSGLTIEELYQCVVLSDNREQLDTAVSATIKLKEMVSGKR